MINKLNTFLANLVLLVIIYSDNLAAFDKVIIWGHKLHSSTHSYVHEGFFKGFQSLGYQTYWFDDADDVSSFDFSNSLFITEGHVEKNIPLRTDCLYFLHNTDQKKYRELSINPIAFQVYTDDVLTRNCIKVDTCIYYDFPDRCLYMPWATDLLPDEIEEGIANLPQVDKQNRIFWVGTIGSGIFGNQTTLQPFIEACTEQGIPFFMRNPWATGVSPEEHRQLISQSYMAPAIVGEWQQTKGYVPCRIFKNISYGQMGITNSERVYELFDKKIVYNPDSYQLFFDAHNRLATLKTEELVELMDLVKRKHTYINRIQTMLEFLSLIQTNEIKEE